MAPGERDDGSPPPRRLRIPPTSLHNYTTHTRVYLAEKLVVRPELRYRDDRILIIPHQFY